MPHHFQALIERIASFQGALDRDCLEANRVHACAIGLKVFVGRNWGGAFRTICPVRFATSHPHPTPSRFQLQTLCSSDFQLSQSTLLQEEKCRRPFELPGTGLARQAELMHRTTMLTRLDRHPQVLQEQGQERHTWPQLRP